MNCLHYTSAVPQPFLLLIAANLALAGFLGWNWSLWPVPTWLEVQRSKAVFFLTLYDIINDMKYFWNSLRHTSAVPQPLLLLIAANLDLAGYLGWKWSLWPVPTWLAVQRSKAVSLLTLHDSINDMKHFQKFCIIPQQCHSHFVVDGWQFGPSWMFILSMIWNTSELSTSHHILNWSVFARLKRVFLSYNLQYTKYISCTRNIWMIFEYHDENYEWIFIHQIFIELVPQQIFTFWILLCWTLVAIRAITMHTDISK